MSEATRPRKTGHENDMPKKEQSLQKSLVPGSRDKAVARLGLDKLPFDIPLNMVLRGVGGFEGALQYAAMLAQSDERYMRLMYLVENASPSDRKVLKAGDWLKAADIDPSDFVGDMARMAYKMNADAGAFIAAVAHPQIVQAAVKSAKKVKGGVKDREMLFKAVGFLPVPKSANIHLHANTAVVEKEETVGMPSFEADSIETAGDLMGEVIDVTPQK